MTSRLVATHLSVCALLFLGACGDDDGTSMDADVPADAAGDAATTSDGAPRDQGTPRRDVGPGNDAGPQVDGGDDGGADASVPAFDTIDALFAGTDLVAEARGGAPAGYRSFDVSLAQPIDRDAPGATYEQLAVFLVPDDVDHDTPLTLHLSGYGFSTDVLTEVTALHGGAQIAISYRYGHEPVPMPGDPSYEFLSTERGTADVQVWLDLLRGYFRGPVVSAGVSRGAGVALAHRMLFPGQVDGTVAYVLPDVDGAPDSRYEGGLRTIGPAACQSALEELQRALLSTRRAELVANIGRSLTPPPSFERVGGPERALEAIVVDLALGFWQFYGEDVNCDAIPAVDADLGELFRFLFNTRMLPLATDQQQDFFTTFYILAGRTEGFPALPTAHLDDLLTTNPPNLEQGTFPPGVDVTFDGAFDRRFDAFIADEVDHVVQVVGELDGWNAFTHADAPARDHRLFEAPGVGHGASIADLSAADRDSAEAMIRAWLE